jgi:myotubularin-related protein 1/2
MFAIINNVICVCGPFKLCNRHLEIEQAHEFFNAHVKLNTRVDGTAETATRSSGFTDITELSLLISGKPASSATTRRSSYSGTAPVPLANGGWVTFRTSVEYNRMGIPDPYWRITSENNDFSLCPTYPPALVLPVAIDDLTIREAAPFRSKNRFPVLSWRDPKTKASLCRSSQPMVGITQKRSTTDELLIEKINMAGQEAYRAQLDKTLVDPWSSDSCKPFVFMDARPKINAQANQAAGKGFENPEFYLNSRIRFLDIPNIHAVRNSLERLEELCVGEVTSDAGFLKNVEATKWLTHIRMILTGAMRIAHCIHRERLSGKCFI